MVPPHGLEPRLADSKSAVLPLDDGGVSGPGESNPHLSAPLPVSRLASGYSRQAPEPCSGPQGGCAPESYYGVPPPVSTVNATEFCDTPFFLRNQGAWDMNIDPLRFVRSRDTPRLLLLALRVLISGRPGTAARLCKTCVRVLLLALGLIALTGCAHTQYLTRSCISAEQYNKLTGKADEDTRPLAGSILELRAYSGMLLGVLETCAEPVK